MEEILIDLPFSGQANILTKASLKLEQPMNPQDVEELVFQYLMKKGLPLQPALAFDDVRAIDRLSDIGSRGDIKNTKTYLTPGISLNTPIVSSNMDTVTGMEMAVAMAHLGGIGFIHQFSPLEKRVAEVAKVKRVENSVIWNPVTISEDATLAKAKELQRQYEISSLLVVNKKGKLVGMLTSRDMRFKTNLRLKVKETMGRQPLVMASPNFNAQAAKFLMERTRVEKLPLVDRNGRPVGLMTAKDMLQQEKFPKAARDNDGRLMVGAAVRLNGDYMDEAEEFLRAGADVLLLDTARGFSKKAGDAARVLKKKYPSIPLVVGNVDTPAGVAFLAEAGADCVKVGIGPGAACKTQIETGVGLPLLYTIATCAPVAKELGVKIMSDGGIRNGSCLVKALVAGADTVMVGSLLAGTEESPGLKKRESNGQLWKIYRGSASLEHQLDRIEEGNLDTTRNPEGESGKVPYSGTVEEVIGGLMGGLRSAMSYLNAHNLKELENVVFQWVSRAANEEGNPRV